MSRYTLSVRDILLSLYYDGKQYGYDTDENGMYLHYNDIIENTYSKFFDNMQLAFPLDNQFKKDFCKRFYNKNIGFETFARFKIELESVLNSECYNYLRLYDEIRNKDIMDMIDNMNIDSTGEATQDGKNLNISALTPEEKLSIIYHELGEDKTITVADALGEGYNHGETAQKGNTKGYSGVPLFTLLNNFARIPDIQAQMFNIIENKCFLKVW